jgi:HSP20 family protein
MSANHRERIAGVRRDDVSAEFDRLFADLARRARHGCFEPNSDMFVDRDRIVVQLEVAGADAETLRIALDEQHLVILGRRIDRSGATGAIHQKEIQYGEFVKKLHLPVPVVDDAATAVYRDGILTITLPVAAHAQFPTGRTEVRMVVKRTLA